jgi:tRNA-dihydrouridine synthase
MVGISHAAFRKLVRSYTPEGVNPLIFTEMLSTKKVPHESVAKTRELRVYSGETHHVPQLLGNSLPLIEASIARLNVLNPWGYDVNMGCPAKHILQHNYGVALMGDSDYAARIVEATKKYSAVPVSVKLRGQAGMVQDIDSLVRFTRCLQNAGADWISLHARPQAQGHKGEANWQLGADVAKALNIPVVINGGIQTSADAISIVRDFGADGAMIARAAAARPWIFWQIAEDLGISAKPMHYSQAKAPRTPAEEGREFVNATIRLLEFLRELFVEEDFIQERVAFFAAMASPWLDFGHAFWKLTTRMEGVEKLHERLIEFQEKSIMKMTPRIKFW